jgi:hypothetical protein
MDDEDVCLREELQEASLAFGGRFRSRNAQRLRPASGRWGPAPREPTIHLSRGHPSKRITSAPQAARKRVPVGPGTTRVESRTLIPARGAGRASTLPRAAASAAPEPPRARSARHARGPASRMGQPTTRVDRAAKRHRGFFASTSFCSISSPSDTSAPRPRPRRRRPRSCQEPWRAAS